jgi:hypothetical protein
MSLFVFASKISAHNEREVGRRSMRNLLSIAAFVLLSGLSHAASETLEVRGE